MQPLKAVLGSVLLFVLATIVYLVVLFREAGQRDAAIALSAIMSRTVLNPYYWVAFAITLWIGWRIATWLVH